MDDLRLPHSVHGGRARSRELPQAPRARCPLLQPGIPGGYGWDAFFELAPTPQLEEASRLYGYDAVFVLDPLATFEDADDIVWAKDREVRSVHELIMQGYDDSRMTSRAPSRPGPPCLTPPSGHTDPIPRPDLRRDHGDLSVGGRCAAHRRYRPDGANHARADRERRRGRDHGLGARSSCAGLVPMDANKDW